MKKSRELSLIISEYVLLAAVLLYWFSTTLTNPVAIVLSVIMICQVIFKSRLLGIIIASLLNLGCLFMILALISEVSEFPTFNSDAKVMLFVGLFIFLSIIGFSSFMFFKYLFISAEDNEALVLNQD